MENFWKKVSEQKPYSYKTGLWDGKMSDEIMFVDDNEIYYIGRCIQGVMGGSEYCNFVDQDGFPIENVTHWANIPSIL